MEKLSQRIEDAVYSLIRIFATHEPGKSDDFSLDIRSTAPVPAEAESQYSEMNETEQDPFVINCKEVLNHFKARCMEKIIHCLKQSLETIKKRVLSSKIASQKDSSSPLFR